MARRTKQQWQVLVEQHAQSVLTTRDFCQQHNIHLQTFYSRRHALGLATPTKRSKKCLSLQRLANLCKQSWSIIIAQ